MTIQELIELLQNVEDKDREVVMERDEIAYYDLIETDEIDCINGLRLFALHFEENIK